MSAWMIPGAPLPHGRGWRLWYALTGSAEPQPVTVVRSGAPLAVSRSVQRQPALPGFDRTIYTVDVTLPADERPGRSYEVHVPEWKHLRREPFRWQTLPDRLPADGLSFVFGSCYWQNDDGEGQAQSALEAVLKFEQPRPSFKLLLGDQVYLDWPVTLNPFALAKGAHHVVGRRYEQYWDFEPYRAYLAAIPNHFVCDDHEFWNDFPERQAQLPHTWRASSRQAYGAAATDWYRAFQGCANPQGADQAWVTIDLDPVSLFLTDTRSERTHIAEKVPHFMAEPQWQALEQWQRGLRGPGLLALGQPLFQDDGNWKDHSLSNFRADYQRLLRIIEDSHRGRNQDERPHDIVVLTGDIHNARYTRARLPLLQHAEVHELTASASSRIGPYTGMPQQNAVPATVPPQETGDAPSGVPWRTSQIRSTVPYDSGPADGEPYACVNDNFGVVRLFPVTSDSHAVRLEFVSYQVKNFRRPAWRFWDRARSLDYRRPAGLRTYQTTLKLS